MNTMTDAAIRKAMVLEFSKRECERFYDKDILYNELEKSLLTYRKIYRDPMATWANKYFKNDGKK